MPDVRDRKLSLLDLYDRLGYRPHNAQLHVHLKRARFKALPMGRRLGKSLMGGYACVPHAFVPCPETGGGQVGWIVGPQYVDAEKEFRVAYDALRRAGVDRHSIKFKQNADSGDLHIKTTWGFELVGRSAAHPETLVGEGLNFAIMAEAGRHKRRTWTEYIRPALADRRGWAMLTGVPEGKSESSLLYQMYQHGQSTRQEHDEWWSVRYPSWANNVRFPGGRQDPEILSLEALLTDDEFRRQICAEFTDKSGRVMKEWDDDIHLYDLDYEPTWRTFLAVDPGYRNAYRVLVVQVSPFDDVNVIKEWSFTDKDSTEVAQEIGADPTWGPVVRKAEAIYSDPAQPDQRSTLSRVLGVPARGGTQSELRVRLSLLRRALKERNLHLPDDTANRWARRPRILVDRRCSHLTWEANEGYRWPERRTEQGVGDERENPIKGNDHSWEALGRFMIGFFGRDLDLPVDERAAIELPWSIANVG